MDLASNLRPDSARIAPIFRSSAFRIAVAFACAVTLTTYIVFAFVYLRFYASNVTLVHSVLEDEVKRTKAVPLEQLKQQLGLRLTEDLRHLDYVGLYDSKGRMTFGNIAHDLSVPQDGKTHLLRTKPPQADAAESENALFVSGSRPDGGTLVLGRSLVYVDRLEIAMFKGFATTIIPVIIIALLIGTIVSIRASRRLSTIQDAIDHVMRGDLYVRLPTGRGRGDVNELVRAVNQMLDEIVRLLNQIKSVGDNIAHDLRAPLAVMRARLERGLAGHSEATLRALTAEALSDLGRAMTTVTALLRISELESGLRRSAFDKVDLADVCRDVFDLYEPLAEAKGATLSLDATQPCIVTGDGDLLREALANLIDNAIKFAPTGGHVTVMCGRKPVLVSVTDDGPGIPLAEHEKIFKRFYRSKATSATPGTGLGLSMAATIVELHGFKLRVQDNKPGATFEIVDPTTALWDEPCKAIEETPALIDQLRLGLPDKILIDRI